MIENAGRCQTALTPVLKAEGNESCGDRHLRPAPRQTGRAPLRSRAKRDGFRIRFPGLPLPIKAKCFDLVRGVLSQYALLAQLVEQRTFNPQAEGSRPSERTTRESAREVNWSGL